MELIFPLLIVFMIGLLFMSSRQRKKQQHEHDEMTRALVVGDVVLMVSGVSGTVVDVDDEQTIDVEIAPDVITTWRRYAVREKLVEETDTDTDTEGSDADGTDDADEAPASSEPSETTATSDGAASTVPSRSS